MSDNLPSNNNKNEQVLDYLTLDNPEDNNSDKVAQAEYTHQELHVGPLPPPDQFAKYDAILPGSADRILSMAEKEQDIRLQCQCDLVGAEVSNSKLGVWFAFILGLCAILGGVYCSSLGYGLSGGTISVAGLASIVGSFIYGTRISAAPKPKKNKPLPKQTEDTPQDVDEQPSSQVD